MNNTRKMLVELAEEILRMNYENICLEKEVKELREYKKQRQDQDAQYVNDSVNEINNVVKAINDITEG